MPAEAEGSWRGDLTVTRLALQTIVAVDLGWVMAPEAADAFLWDRGRPGWLGGLADEFTQPANGLDRPRVQPPSYGRSAEYGRPTFSDEFANSYMPLVFEPQSPPEYMTGVLLWRLNRLKVGPTGALSVCVHAELRDAPQPALDVIHSYHQFRRDVRDRWPDLVGVFLRYWSSTLPRYRLTETASDALLRHVENYDVVDFDFEVDGVPRKPKDVYADGPVPALRALAGLTRMSHVWSEYSEENVRALARMDLGSRPDELWIVNVERLTSDYRFIEAAETVDTYAELAKVQAPVLAIQGSEDEEIPRESRRHFEEAMKRSGKTYRLVEGGNHDLSDPHFMDMVDTFEDFLVTNLLNRTPVRS